MDKELIQAINVVLSLARQVAASGEVHEQRLAAQQKIKTWFDANQKLDEVAQKHSPEVSGSEAFVTQ